MICYHLPRTGSGQPGPSTHAFPACPNPEQFCYMNAKRHAAKQAQRQRRGWFPRFITCWMCYNPQVVCDQQGQSQCEYPDLVLPICWAIFQKRAWVEHYLGALGGRHVAHSEEQYMLWLREEQVVFSKPGFNTMAVADLVMQHMVLG